MTVRQTLQDVCWQVHGFTIREQNILSDASFKLTLMARRECSTRVSTWRTDLASRRTAEHFISRILLSGAFIHTSTTREPEMPKTAECSCKFPSSAECRTG